MDITFLGQGFESESSNSVGNFLINLFQEANYNKFTGISAFASEAGVAGLEECISTGESITEVNIIVGVDQEGTPKEALERIKNLDVNSYVFYQKEAPIFHPKIYLFEGDNSVAIIIGSSNLTGRGLFQNVESSVLVKFETTDEQGIAFLNEFKSYYSSLFDFSDPNLFEITDENIQNFINDGVVPTKRVWERKHRKRTTDSEPSEEPSLDVPTRSVPRIPSTFRGRGRTNPTVTELVTELEMEESEQLTNDIGEDFLWESGPLTERDLTIPRGNNTNQTGSMGLKKGLMREIDHRHFFREDLFANLVWANSTRRGSEHLEIANVRMRLIVEGEDRGVFTLKLTHNPRTDITAYRQNNSMTQLSWGDARTHIAQRHLIGSSARLRASSQDTEDFILTIG